MYTVKWIDPGSPRYEITVRGPRKSKMRSFVGGISASCVARTRFNVVAGCLRDGDVFPPTAL